MPVSVVDARGTGGNGNPFDVTKGGLIVDGNLLTAIMFTDFDGVDDMSPPDGSWAEISALEIDNGFNNMHARVWEKIASSEPATWTFTAGGNSGGVSVLAFDGFDTGSHYAGMAKNNTTSNSAPESPSVTATAAGLLVCAVGGSYDPANPGQSLTHPTGMTERTDYQLGNYVLHGTATLQLGATGATGVKVWTPSSVFTWEAAMGLSFVVAPAGGAPTPPEVRFGVYRA